MDQTEALVTPNGGGLVRESPQNYPPQKVKLGTDTMPRFIGDVLSRELTYSPKKALLKMISLFARWDMLVPWRVLQCAATKILPLGCQCAASFLRIGTLESAGIVRRYTLDGSRHMKQPWTTLTPHAPKFRSYFLFPRVETGGQKSSNPPNLPRTSCLSLTCGDGGVMPII